MIETIKAVIFDLDETLYDRNAAQIRVVELIMLQFPQVFHGLDNEQVITTFAKSDSLSIADFEAGMPSNALREKRIRSFLKLLGLKEDDWSHILEMYVQTYPTINMSIAGAVVTVKELSARFPIAVISNGLPDVQYTKIESIGLKDVISHVILSEEIGIRKPDPRIFHRAADILRVQPDECLYVGDSYRNDIIGAKNAGMLACWYNPESIALEEIAIKPDLIITKMGALTRILER